MPATERAVVTVAQMMIRMPVAEAAQAHHNEAKTMTWIPVTETAPGTVLEPVFEAAAVLVQPRLEFPPSRLKSLAGLLKLVAVLLEPVAQLVKVAAPCLKSVT